LKVAFSPLSNQDHLNRETINDAIGGAPIEKERWKTAASLGLLVVDKTPTSASDDNASRDLEFSCCHHCRRMVDGWDPFDAFRKKDTFPTR